MARNNSEKKVLVKRKRLNVARILVFLLFIYLVVCVCIYIYKEPVRHYEIKGNEILSDTEILRYAGIDNYPPFVSISSSRIKKKLKKNNLIKDVNIKYGFNFQITIEVVENKPMFISKETDEVCLADGTLVPYEDTFVGIPILLNNTPMNVMKVFAKNLSTIDDGIFYMINDIEYKPSYNQYNQIIDEYRFLLSMNDKNLVFVNGKRLKPLNRYLDVISTTKLTQNGVFYLDGDESRYPFRVFDNEVVTPEEEKEEEVLPEISEGDVNED